MTSKATTLADIVNTPGGTGMWGGIGGTLSNQTDLQAALDSKVNVSQSLGLINRLINPNFIVNQRAVSGTVVLAAGVYGHDRWKAGASGCTYTFSTTANVTTIVISAGSLIQTIEGGNLDSGTYILTWSGVSQGKIGAGSFAASGVTGSITGGTNTNVEFGTGTLIRPQLELGTTATQFDFRPTQIEDSLCKRYYKRYAAGLYMVTMSGASVGFINADTSNMRANPTITTNLDDASYGTGGNQWAFYQSGIAAATKTGTVAVAVYSYSPIGGVFFTTATYSVVPNVALLTGDRYMAASAEL